MAGRRPRSLQRELLFALLASVVLIWAVTLAFSYFDVEHELDELLDAHLAQSSALLIAQAGHDLEEIDVEHTPLLHRYARRVSFQVWEQGRVLRIHSANAPNTRLSDAEQGFSDNVVDGVRWRVFSAWDANRRNLVQVGERRESRTAITATVARNMLPPLVVALPALAALIAFVVTRALRPLTSLNRELAARAPDNLAALDIGDAPAEVAPLVASLNRLFDRTRRSLARERQFTADAAHELRTPLAALRAHAQVARGATHDDEHLHALDQVIAGCDRAAHLVDQLLTLARLEPGAPMSLRQPCELRRIAQDVLADLAPAALDKHVNVELDATVPGSVQGDPRLLGILLRNLVDNAIRYGPDGSLVHVRIHDDADQACLVVSDEGPGVPAAQRELLGRRFHRLAHGDVEGTGLGLSIVKRIAELHGAALRFEEATPKRGLRVAAIFPACVATSAEIA
jgi:two-component system, OmpR family, sensor kinase